MLFVVLVMILLFSVLTSIPYDVAQSVGEVLKFIIAAAHKLDVVGKSELAYYGPPTNGNACVVVMECFLHVPL